MKQNFTIELPDNGKVTVLFHSLDVAVPTRLADSGAAEHYEVRFPKDATVRIVHSADEFAVKIVPAGETPDDCDLGSDHSSESPSP